MVYSKIIRTPKYKSIKKEDVYNMLLNIPRGKVVTYGSIAKVLGNPKASRLIGQIIGRNPNPISVPCHRVVMSNGKIGGYMYGIDKKIDLLRKEGIVITENNKVLNFENIKYTPELNAKHRIEN